MIYKIFFLTFLIFKTWALPWNSELHHLEPLMNQVNDIDKEGFQSTCEDPIKNPNQYISDLPKNEPWRKFYKLPTLLTDKFYKINDVCEEAKKQNQQEGKSKKYALVANKTHLCDAGHRACLSALKSISDPCNTFVQENFQVFHIRTFIGQHKVNGYQEMMNEYGQMGPSMLVINLETCRLEPTINAEKELKKGQNEKKLAKENYYYTPPSLEGAKDSKGVYKFKSDNDSIRFEAMRDSLFTTMPQLKNLDKGKNDCFENGKRTLPGISDTELVKYGDIEIKGAPAIRKLMDEQYIKATGIHPYK